MPMPNNLNARIAELLRNNTGVSQVRADQLAAVIMVMVKVGGDDMASAQSNAPPPVAMFIGGFDDIAPSAADPTDPINRLAEFIPLTDGIMIAVAELRSQLYNESGIKFEDAMAVVDAARRKRLDRRLRQEPVAEDRRTGHDRRGLEAETA